MPAKERHFLACLAATVISVCGGLSVADEPAKPVAQPAAQPAAPTAAQPAAQPAAPTAAQPAANPPSDKWVAPPAVSPAIEIPRNVPERDPATPAVSSTSDAAGSTDASGEAAVPGPEVPRVYETLSRATDRRYSITTFNNVQRGFRRVYVACKRALTAPAQPAAPAQ